MSSKKPKEPKIDWKELKATVNQWTTDAESARVKNLSATRARLAAAGAKPGSNIWEMGMAQVQSDYEAAMKDITKSKTYKMVQEHIQEQQQKDLVRQQEIEREKAQQSFMQNTGMGVMDFYSSGYAGKSASELEQIQQEYFGQMGMIGDNPIGKTTNWWGGGL